MQYILYSVLLAYGQRMPAFLRFSKRWEPLIPLLMDHVLLDIDPDIDDSFMGSVGGSNSGLGRGIGTGVVPIEAKLRSLSVRLLYEVCRVQKMSLQELSKWCFALSFLLYARIELITLPSALLNRNI